MPVEGGGAGGATPKRAPPTSPHKHNNNQQPKNNQKIQKQQPKQHQERSPCGSPSEDYEDQIQRLHGQFVKKTSWNSSAEELRKPSSEWDSLIMPTAQSPTNKRSGGGKRVVSPSGCSNGGGGHVCYSLFASCAGSSPPPPGQAGGAEHPQRYREQLEPAVSLSEILGDGGRVMGNGAPGRITQIAALRRELNRKDQEIARLNRELHKLKSVLQQTSFRKDEVLGSLHQVAGMAGQSPPPTANKRQGVSAESSRADQTARNIRLLHHEKDFRSKQLIKEALLENDFLKNLDSSQTREVVECMYSRRCAKGSFLIKEGEAGSHLYVSASGTFEVIKDGTVLGNMGPGKAFGELAILYNCTRTASIRVVEDGEVWVLDRKIFQSIMHRTGLQRLEDSLTFLKSVPLLANLGQSLLTKIADSLQLETYHGGHYIVRQGASGDTFYIIKEGKVKVTLKKPGEVEEEEVRKLNTGDYFGEQALLKEDSRTANVIALPPGVECLTLDRESFMLLIGDLNELQEKNYTVHSRPPSAASIHENESDFDKVDFHDLEIVATLGVGGFGRVELVTCQSSGGVYALKCMKKCHILETHQETHVYNERDIMMQVRCPFICRLYQTFKDKKYVYLLMEACLGGEVWSILRDRSCFDDTTACFITACVVEALDYLHARNIVYRDLKPENLLLDNTGYVKMADFGFAKKLASSSGKTWTFCGTPEYVAPEVILNRGHDKAVDYWALGILMHELLTGMPPFTATDPMKTYTLILKGVDSVVFPRHVSRTAQNLIKKLCRDAPAERLGSHHAGIVDIKKHKWFQGFDWDGLRTRTMTPPIIPKIKGPTDTSNFDAYTRDNTIPPDELSNWDADF